MDGVVAYILSKKYTKDSLIGVGAIKGAPCQVQSVNKVGKTTTVTLKWEDDLGVTHTQAFDIEDGLDGVSIVGATINSSGHLILTLSNSNTIDCGKVVPQYDTLPSASASNVGAVLQYIGTTTPNYINGYFYKCVNNGGTYSWQNINVQDSYTKAEIGNLSNLPDNTKNVVENITALNSDITDINSDITDIKGDIVDINGDITDIKGDITDIKGDIVDINGDITDINTALNGKQDILQYSTLPTPTEDIAGKIVQYIGTSTASLTNGYCYQCRLVGSNYEWVQKNVQPNNGGSGKDNVEEGYFNSVDNLFYEESTFVTPIIGEDKVLYIDLNTELLYRYNGNIFIRVDESSDGQTIQVTTMPTASVDELNNIYQYVGTTTEDYTNGYFYKCIYDGTYKWVNINTQNSYTKAEIGDLTDLPDNTADVVQNISLLNTTKQDIIQYTTMPTATNSNLGKVFQYVGTTDSNYTNGYFYRCEYDSQTTTYKWVIANDFALAEDVYTKTEIGDLSNLPDTTKDVVGNINDIVTSVSTKQNIMQFDTLPIASSSNVDDIVQYTGASNPNYINGYFYKCVLDGSSYKWENVEVQPTSGTSSVDSVNGKTGTVILDAKDIGLQVETLPTADNAHLGNIVQYVGSTGGGYTNGYFYKCVYDNVSGTYSWELVADFALASDVYTKTQIGALTNLPDTTKDVIANIADLNTNKQDALTEGASIDITNNVISVEVDSSLSDSSTNPVQNKVIKDALDDKVNTSLVGANSGIATLNENGKVPSTQLPSYVDDVVEGYLYNGAFYEDIAHTKPITGETGKIYIELTTEKTYRWSGSVFVEISASLTLGETNSTAYYGDKGKTAYDHSQITNGTNPHNTTANNVNLATSISVDGVTKSQVEEALSAINTLAASNKTNKADKVSGATSGNFAGLDSNGNLTDSGKKASDFIEKSNTAGLVKNDGSIDTNTYATTATVADKADKVASATTGDFATLDSNGNLTDSGISKDIVPSGASSSNKLATANDIPDELNDLDDVTITSGTLANSQLLIYNSSSSKWVNGTYSKSDIGLGDVVNTGDSDTPVSGGTTKFTTGGAYTELAKKADKVASATNGHLAGLDSNGNLTDSGVVASKVIEKVTTATGLLKDDGTVDTTTYASTADAYLVGDTAETALADADYVPFYDSSATAKRKTLWSNIKSVLKTYFDTLYTNNTGTVTSVATGAGLTGGAVTTSGTIKANLVSETASTLEASSMGTTSNRQYAVGLDKNNKLSVNIPWEDTTYGVVSKTANGLAPQLPNETTTTKFLRQDGSWEVPNYPTVNDGTLTISQNGTTLDTFTANQSGTATANVVTDEWTSANILIEGSTITSFSNLNTSYAYKPYIECADGVIPPTLTSAYFSGTTYYVTFSAVTSSQAGQSGSSCKMKLRIIK